MDDVTRILFAIEQGDPQAAEHLLPLVYDELRRLAAEKMAQEKPGQPLRATALVHEAYIRLVDVDRAEHWHSRGHFFAAAAEAIRKILIEGARRKKFPKRGAVNRGSTRAISQASQGPYGDRPRGFLEPLAAGRKRSPSLPMNKPSRREGRGL